VQIGALVMCNSYRNPQYLADALRTVDHISGGRLVVGIGAGWFERDYDEYGYEFGTAGSRLRALARDLPKFRERLAKLNPQPLGPMPIMIGGSGERKTLRLVAEHADWWHAFGDAERYRQKAEVLRGHCEAVGRDPGEIVRIWAVPRDDIGAAEQLRAEGITHFTVGIGGDGHGYDLGPVRELLQWRDAQRG
jgi:probable F420-dependent oxidoreductase